MSLCVGRGRPLPKSQRRTGPDDLTPFTTLSCTMQTGHLLNRRLYLNLVHICQWLDWTEEYIENGHGAWRSETCFFFCLSGVGLGFVFSPLFWFHWESTCYIFVIPLLRPLQCPVLTDSSTDLIPSLGGLHSSWVITFSGWEDHFKGVYCRLPQCFVLEMCLVACLMSSSPLKQTLCDL